MDLRPGEVEALRTQLERTEQRLQQLENERRRRTKLAWLVGVLALVSATAWSGSLTVFSPNSPAIASEVNANFQQLKTWLELKVGPVDQPPSVTTIITTSLDGGFLAERSLSGTKLVTGSVPESALSPALSCPDAAARTQYGQCIFIRPLPISPGTLPAYVFNYRQAAAACVLEGARLCTRGELSAAQAAGYPNTCAYGWLADRTDNATAYAGFPMQTQGPSGCGTAGMNDGPVAMTTQYAAWCCK
jgi:hypothetical protein